MKMCSSSLIIREIQIRTVRYLTVRNGTNKKDSKQNNLCEQGLKQRNPYPWLVVMVQVTMENMKSSQKSEKSFHMAQKFYFLHKLPRNKRCIQKEVFTPMFFAAIIMFIELSTIARNRNGNNSFGKTNE